MYESFKSYRRKLETTIDARVFTEEKDKNFLKMTLKTVWLFSCIIIFVAAQTWRGNLETYKTWTYSTCRRCVLYHRWGCGQWRTFLCSDIIESFRCAKGWTHRGDYNCIVPICLPTCGPGQCIAPNTCDCKNLATGQYCQTLITSPSDHVTPGSVSTTANATATPDVRNSTQL